ncbi:MAG: signal peptidase I [Paludibacter sp.]
MKAEELNNQLLDFAVALLDDNHSLSIRMQGYSMYPTLRIGDIGQVEKCSPDDLRIGDIVVFKSNNKLIAHRLINIINRDGIQLFITNGDKNYHKDPPFTSEALVGKLSSFKRKGRIIQLSNSMMKLRRLSALHFSSFVIPFFNLSLKITGHVNKLSTNLKSLKQNLSIITSQSKKELIVSSIIAGFQGILPFVIIVTIKSLIDYLTQSTELDAHQQLIFVSLLVITALVFLVNAILSEINGFFSEKLSQSVTRRIYEMLHKKHASLDLSHYENPAEQDKIHRAVQEASFRPIKMINELLGTIKSIAAALFLVTIFVSIRWYLIVLLFVAIIPGILVKLKFSQKAYKLKISQSTKEREMYYFNRVLTGFPFAKEMKLFGFFGFFLQRFSNAQNTLFKQKIDLRKSELRLAISSQIFAIILIFFSLGYVSYLKLSGAISIGTVVLFFFAFQRGYSVLNEFFKSLTQIREDNTFLNDFMSFLNMPTKSNAQKNVQSHFSLKKEIKIENVSFRYESSKREALKSVNINIPAGKTVAFVGANGSGKTTLIKLLCGFYQPDSGKILFDGIDATQIGQTTVCENITAVFQDFALYNIFALENIGLGNIQTPIDLEKAKKAAEAAGIDEIIEHLPNGYNTLLGNLFNGGEELSVGQWQKMSIARAFYRDSPLILMDEPSSALDVASELQIINSLKKLSRNKTAVIISHRLTTVQWADLIYVFDEGEVLESGNHQELLALKGKYYSLFHTANEKIYS